MADNDNDDDKYVKDADGEFVLDDDGNRVAKPEHGGPASINGQTPAEFFAGNKKKKKSK